MDRWEILEKIEDMQDDVDNMNFQGSQESELWLREAVADYIVELVNNLSQHLVSKSFYCADVLGKCNKQCEDCKDIEKD